MELPLKPVTLMSIDSPESLKKESESDSGFLIGIVLTGGRLRNNDLQCHTGFVIRDNQDPSNTTFQLLHFACDRELHLEPFPQIPKYGFQWIKFIKPSNIDYLVAQFQNIYLKNSNSIPYAIIYNQNQPYFDDKGNNLNNDGLTCATFVMELLKRNGFKVLDIDNWKSDAQWQHDIAFNRLIPREPKNTIDFLRAQYQAIGISPRFTPQQIVGGCHYYAYAKAPLCFDFVEAIAVPETITELQKLQIIT